MKNILGVPTALPNSFGGVITPLPPPPWTSMLQCSNFFINNCNQQKGGVLLFIAMRNVHQIIVKIVLYLKIRPNIYNNFV